MAGKDFTDKQLMAIDLLSQGVMQKDIQEQLDVSHNTLWKWKKNPQFMDAVVESSRTCLKDALPSIYSVLATKAIEGSSQHIKILLEHLEKIEEERTKYAETAITFTWER